MFLKSKSYTHLAILLMLLFIFSGCGDDSSTAVEQPDPPAVPEAVPAEINGSIFEENNPVGEEFVLFTEAATLAQFASGYVNSGTNLGQVYLEFTRSRNAEYEDGAWTWTFSSSETDVNVSVRTTAEQLQDGFQWNIFVSSSLNDETSSEYRFLSGFISEDGNSGNWQYFPQNGGDQPILEYQWETISETQSSFTTIFRDSDGSNEQRIDYERNGANNTLEYTGFTNYDDLVVYWNSENRTGYIDRDGEDRRCWDESFAEIACS